MATQTKKTQTNKASGKQEFKGKPEVDEKTIAPLGNTPKVQKLKDPADTPVETFMCRFTQVYIGATSVATAAGAYAVWQDSWAIDIAHFFWPFGIATVATLGIVEFMAKRE